MLPVFVGRIQTNVRATRGRENANRGGYPHVAQVGRGEEATRGRDSPS
jgi:hypothetical protein